MATLLVHGPLIASFEGRDLVVIPQASLLVARLELTLAANNIEDERITGELLVRLDFENVTSLDAAPVADLELLAALTDHVLLDMLHVDELLRLLQLTVMEQVQTTVHQNRDHED